MLGIQVISALRDLYGKNGAETISGLCGTRVVLAAPDQETARWSAESLGRGEVEEYSHGMSYGASVMRDGVSLTQRREMRSLALPSEIMRLENLKGYLKFPGPWPVARIGLDYVTRPKAAERFVPREDSDTVETPENTAEEAPVIGDHQGDLDLKKPQGSGPATRERVETTEPRQASATPRGESARQPHKKSEKDETGAADDHGTDTEGVPALSLPGKSGNSTPGCGEPRPKPPQGRLRRL